MGDLELMQAVQRVAGNDLEKIGRDSSIPIAFWAALSAGESGAYLARGDTPEKITRFEKNVYLHLEAVAQGSSKAYGSIDLSDLDAEVVSDATEMALEMFPKTPDFHATFLTPSFADCHGKEFAALAEPQIRRLATSFCYTQIMGYHCMDWPGVSIGDIIHPGTHYPIAAKLMSDFVKRYDLDSSKEFSEMAHCWNCGNPDLRKPTYDPQYIPNLLRRMEIWKSLN